MSPPEVVNTCVLIVRTYCKGDFGRNERTDILTLFSDPGRYFCSYKLVARSVCRKVGVNPHRRFLGAAVAEWIALPTQMPEIPCEIPDAGQHFLPWLFDAKNHFVDTVLRNTVYVCIV